MKQSASSGGIVPDILKPLVLDPKVVEAVEKACAAWLAKQATR